ncbi:hypothetical protein ACLKA7_017391 [Drosophila subpalustris]
MPYLQPGYGDISLMSKKSHVEDFEGVTALFEALTSTPNDGYTYDWQVFSIPTKTDDGDKQHGVIRNCTVLYLDQCTSWNKCRRTCHKTGAASYRWFHDGCCECIGGFCSNYGINESRCSHCPEPACDEDED